MVFQIFEFGNFLQILTKKCQKIPKKVIFGQKTHVFMTFLVENFQKYCLIKKFEKKKNVPRVVS